MAGIPGYPEDHRDPGRRPEPLQKHSPKVTPCESCEDTGWVWSQGPHGENKGLWRMCKDCKWNRC